MRFPHLAVLGLCAWGAWNWYQSRPLVAVSPGVAVMETPHQGASHKAPFMEGVYQLTPLASFKIHARVLSREDYRMDKEADLAPTDLALGWGAMSDPAIYRQLSISQSNRFYYWRYQNPPPAPPEEIARSSANMHLIPATDAVGRRLKQVRPGQLIRFEGHLVEAHDPAGWRWRSSLSRDDTGAGACELVWVEQLDIEPEHR